MRIGVVGGGQLGRMMALAGIPLGQEFVFLDPDPKCPASAVGRVIAAAYDDAAALSQLGRQVDVATFEFENVPAAALAALQAHVRVAPGTESLATSQDRIAEKEFFRRCSIPVQGFAAVSSETELARACGTIGFPGVLKSRRLGYDGRGQAVVRTPADVPAAWAAVGGVPCIYEEFVRFSHELSAIAVRSMDGSTAFYPLCRNTHERGILRTTLAPGEPQQGELERQAHAAMQVALDALGHVGVLTLEFFATDRGLVANEMAPRVHNSGHWTQDGAETSQFENHVRAIVGWPLGGTRARGACGMVNLIGGMPPAEDVLAVPGARLHLYGKEPRKGRKIGHVNVCAPNETVRRAQMGVLCGLAEGSADG
jgi:5-(carboxyamino)imidazole ribonucleotide synthase